MNPLLNAMCDIYYVFYFIWEIKYIQDRTLYFCFTFSLLTGCFATILDGLAVGDFTVWGIGFPYIYCSHIACHFWATEQLDSTLNLIFIRV